MPLTVPIFHIIPYALPLQPYNYFSLPLRVRQQTSKVDQICALSSRAWQGVLAFSVLYIFIFIFPFFGFGELTEPI